MKIAFITDLHIEKEGKFPLNLDTRQHFKAILDKVSTKKYDLIILGGDLCNTEGEEKIYQWIYHQLKDIKIPVLPISGNHDNSLMLAKILQMDNSIKNDHLYYTHSIENYKAIFLDSSSGKLGTEQWNFLEILCENSVENLLIFMHHPPLVCDVVAMEPKYQFKEIEKFKSLLQKHSEKQFYIFTGHFHTDRTIQYKNATICITPSTYVQIDPKQKVFTPIFDEIGYREIEIKPNGEIISFVKYL